MGMKCAGDNHNASHMIDVSKNGIAVWQPHCKFCFEDAADSTVPISVMSIDAYERMMKNVKQGIAS